MQAGMYRGRTWRTARDLATRRRMADFARAARKLPAPGMDRATKYTEIRSYMGVISRTARNRAHDWVMREAREFAR
jgi:hypothetical protein